MYERLYGQFSSIRNDFHNFSKIPFTQKSTIFCPQNHSIENLLLYNTQTLPLTNSGHYIEYNTEPHKWSRTVEKSTVRCVISHYHKVSGGDLHAVDVLVQVNGVLSSHYVLQRRPTLLVRLWCHLEKQDTQRESRNSV